MGLAIAKRLAKEGYNLVLVSRNEEKLEKAKAQIMASIQDCRNTGDETDIRIFPIDLSEAGNPAMRLFEWTKGEGIVPDVLVNDAGVYIHKKLIDATETEQQRIVSVNISALTTLCRLFGREMAEQGGGRYILNIASYSVYMPIEGFSLYASTKAYVRTFSRCISKEFRHHGIKVTAVAPAGIDTGLMQLKPGIQKLARGAGFLASPDTIARISVRALKTKHIHYWIPLWFNILFIPFLWMFQPLFKKVL